MSGLCSISGTGDSKLNTVNGIRDISGAMYHVTKSTSPLFVLQATKAERGGLGMRLTLIEYHLAGTLAYPEEAGVGAATLCSGAEFPHSHPPLSPEGGRRCVCVCVCVGGGGGGGGRKGERQRVEGREG